MYHCPKCKGTDVRYAGLLAEPPFERMECRACGFSAVPLLFQRSLKGKLTLTQKKMIAEAKSERRIFREGGVKTAVVALSALELLDVFLFGGLLFLSGVLGVFAFPSEAVLAAWSFVSLAVLILAVAFTWAKHRPSS